MTNKLVVGCVQNCASADLAASLEEVTELCREGAAQGANLLCMPEYVSCFALTDAGFEVAVGPEDGHPALAHFRALARELEVWMVVGSLAIEHLDAKIANRSYLLDPGGAVVSTYDKIHLFDVDLPNGESYRESEIISPGDRAVVAGTPWGPIGLTICYDLRFPHLYRELAKAGALFLTVPAAFTKTTGQAHWHTLVRSRAIETGAYLIAPSQYGAHGKAETYGHSLVVGPWGEILADGGDGSSVALATLDPSAARTARERIPALAHDRPFELDAAPLRSVSAR